MKIVSANIHNRISLEFKTGIGNAIANAIDLNINVDIHWIYNHVGKIARTPTKHSVESAIEDIMNDY